MKRPLRLAAALIALSVPVFVIPASAGADASGAGAAADATRTGPPPDGKFAVLTGGTEVPGPGDPDGRGVAIVDTLLSDGATTGRVCADFSVARIATPMAAHIHVGRAGVAGPVVVDLTGPLMGERRCVPGVDASLIRAIRRTPAAYYVNVHNEAYPAGAIRGQLHG